MPSLRIRCTITPPSSEPIDVTESFLLSNLPAISIVPEDDLGVLTHNNIQVAFRNDDGFFRELFSGLRPLRLDQVFLTSNIYEIVIERETPSGSWERLFGGAMHVPDSISYDNKEKIVVVDCYSYSKVMESLSTDVFKRALVQRTANSSAGSRVLTFLNSHLLKTGDVVRLTDAVGNEESFTVDRSTGSATVVCTLLAGQTLTNAFVTLETPFERYLSPIAVARSIALAAGYTLDESDFDSPILYTLNLTPTPTPINVNGISLLGHPYSLIPNTSNGLTILACYAAAVDDSQRSLPTPTSNWVSLTVSNNFMRDFTPYFAKASFPPGGYLEQAQNINQNLGAEADTNRQPSATSGSAYIFQEARVYVAGLNHVVGDKIQLRQVLATGQLDYFVNGAQRLLSIATGAVGTAYIGWVEWNPVQGRTWISYQQNLNADPQGAPSIRKVGYYQGDTIHTMLWLDSTKSGQLRFCRRLGTNGTMLFYDGIVLVQNPGSIASVAGGFADTGTLIFYDGASAAVRFTMPFTLGWPHLWTARYCDGHLCFLYQSGVAAYLAVYKVNDVGFEANDPGSLTFRASYLISNAFSDTRAFLTVELLANGREVIVGFAGGEWFVLSPTYDGVISYCDFEDMSCAQAASETASVINAIVNVDNFKTISFKNRRVMGSGEVVGEIAPLLSDTERPLSDIYRGSVSASGKTGGGTAFEVVAGAKEKSASRLELSSRLVTTTGMAAAAAVSTYEFVSNVKSQREVTIADDGTLMLEVFHRVTIDGVPFVVYKIERDVKDQLMSLTLLEVD